MLKTIYYMRQIVDPIAFLNENAKMTPFKRYRLYKDVSRHQEYNAGQPYVADFGSGRIMIAESPVQIELLSCWLAGRTW